MLRTFLRNPDGQAAIFFMFFGAFTIYAASDLQFGSLRQMGPGFFPISLGYLLMFGALVVAIQAFRAVPEPTFATDWRAILAITAAIVIAAYALVSIGAAVAIPLMVVVSALAAGRPKLLSILLTAVILTATAWAIFILGLGLRIPVLEF